MPLVSGMPLPSCHGVCHSLSHLRPSCRHTVTHHMSSALLRPVPLMQVSSRTQLPLSLLQKAQGHPMLVELKNGDTYNGRLSSCDMWMNINLRDVICTSRVSNRRESISLVRMWDIVLMTPARSVCGGTTVPMWCGALVDFYPGRENRCPYDLARVTSVSDAMARCGRRGTASGGYPSATSGATASSTCACRMRYDDYRQPLMMHTM
jgi:small nuclear ribonucleoprotein (snRNP)-like protein